MAAAALLLALMLGVAPGAIPEGPNPLAATGYSSEHENFLCSKFFGQNRTGDTYMLPCKPPHEDWDSPFMNDEFVITAWWPPTMNVIHQYAAAGFNMVLGGNDVKGCQVNGTIPTPATAMDAFDCFVNVSKTFEELGLKVAFAHGSFTSTGDSLSDLIMGGQASMGGVTDAINFSHAVYPTAPEVAFVVGELVKRNLSHLVVQYFLHDDVVANNQAINDAVDWLRTHHPSIVPQTNTGNQGYETLYQDRQPTFVPEEYAIDGNTNADTRQTDVDAELALFESNQYIAQRYRLLPWPLFALGDGGGVHTLASPSLVRVQVYSALAYGMKGLYYYCWGEGIWNVTTQFYGPGNPTPNYNVVKAINMDAKKFGNLLLKTTHVGTIRTPAKSFARTPAADLPVTHTANDDLLIGVFSANESTSYLMIVDTRTEVQNKTMHTELLPVRTAGFTLHAACSGSAATFVAGGVGGYEQMHSADHSISGTAVSVSLKAGAGALIALTGTGCAAVVGNTRQWRFNPRTLSLKGGQELQDLGGKSATYSRYGAARRHYAPGGPAGWESNFILGASYWEQGGFRNDAEAWSFAQSGFSVASIGEAELDAALGYAAAYGTFVFGTTQTGLKQQAMRPDDATTMAEAYSCHTNMMGMVLADSGDAALLAPGAVAAAGALRHAANWMFPLVPNVASVAQAQALAAAGITPLPAVSLPSIGSSNLSAAGWGQATLNLLSDLNAATSNRSMAASMAVTLDACAHDSESINRAGAYWSAIFGAQAIWYEGVGKCAPVGSDKFKMIAQTVRRLTQWVEPLFEKGSSSPAWRTIAGQPDNVDCRHNLAACDTEQLRYNVTAVFSTSSLQIPSLQGVSAAKPGASKSDLVQSMDEELVVIVLQNRTEVRPSSEAGVEFKHGAERYLLVLSTELSWAKGGAPTRPVSVVMREDVTSTQPIEPDAFQGFATTPGATSNSYNPTPVPGMPPTFRGDAKCPLSWLGSKMGAANGGGGGAWRATNGELALPGGSAQLLTYTVAADWKWPQPGAAMAAEDSDHARIGRRPPRKV